MTVGQRRFVSIQPIERWPGTRRSGVRSPFRASFTDTLDMLEKELNHLKATEPTLLTMHSPEDVRLDGRLKTDTRKPSYQGVILEFFRPARPEESACRRCRRGLSKFWTQTADKSRSDYAHRDGEKTFWCEDPKPKPIKFSFPADKYSDWKDNVRAVAMCLEGLRMIERHGVKSEAQYVGYKALPEASSEVQAAIELLLREAAWASDRGISSAADVEQVYKVAAFRAHPDKGGSDARMAAVNNATRVLREHFKVQAVSA